MKQEFCTYAGRVLLLEYVVFMSDGSLTVPFVSVPIALTKDSSDSFWEGLAG